MGPNVRPRIAAVNDELSPCRDCSQAVSRRVRWAPVEVYVVNRSALTPLRSSGAKPAAAEPPSGPKAPRDSVQLSDESKQLATRELSEADEAKVAELKARDQEVRTHEQAHIAASGGHAKGQPSYEFEKGPDGRNYAVSGSVDIDTSPVKGDPKATAAKMRAIRRAATAPAEPSSQDQKVAAEAAAQEQEALREVAEERTAEGTEETADTTLAGAATAQSAGAAPERVDGAPPTRAEESAPEAGLAPSTSESSQAPAAPEVGLASALREPEPGQPRTERSTPSNPPADAGEKPAEAARAPEVDVAAAPERASEPDPRSAFVFNALQQALAIR
jgi:hypothetical protein